MLPRSPAPQTPGRSLGVVNAVFAPVLTRVTLDNTAALSHLGIDLRHIHWMAKLPRRCLQRSQQITEAAPMPRMQRWQGFPRRSILHFWLLYWCFRTPAAVIDRGIRVMPHSFCAAVRCPADELHACCGRQSMLQCHGGEGMLVDM